MYKCTQPPALPLPPPLSHVLTSSSGGWQAPAPSRTVEAGTALVPILAVAHPVCGSCLEKDDTPEWQLNDDFEDVIASAISWQTDRRERWPDGWMG